MHAHWFHGSCARKLPELWNYLSDGIVCVIGTVGALGHSQVREWA
jgi:hypothetical protein